jgi:hypothetical protein
MIGVSEIIIAVIIIIAIIFLILTFKRLRELKWK